MAAVASRQAELAAVGQAQEEALEYLVTFGQAYDNALQDLSMREGLGQKYGAPRRNAQERLRSEMAYCNNGEKRVAALLQRLGEYCATPPGGEEEEGGYEGRLPSSSSRGGAGSVAGRPSTSGSLYSATGSEVTLPFTHCRRMFGTKGHSLGVPAMLCMPLFLRPCICLCSL